MKAELFVARRLFQKGKGSFTRPIINISVGSVALSIAVLVLAVAVLKGFQHEIREKIIGFGSHVQITWYDNNSSYELKPIPYDSAMVDQISAIPGVTHVQPFGIKAGIIKTDDQIEGIVLKGVNPAYNWDFFREKIAEGKIPVLEAQQRSTEILISRHIARKLGFGVGDQVILYFVQDPPRYRSFTVSGIYETGLAEFDEMFLFGDIRQIARLNDWDSSQVSGYEVLISDFRKLDAIAEQVNEVIPGEMLAESIRDRNPQLFGWLALMDQNVMIILAITILVALIHMTSILLIMVIERTQMIGILKAIGMDNRSLRSLFIYHSAFLLAKGVVIGNAIAISVALLQQYTGFFKLDQENYYLDTVPVRLLAGDLLLVNAGVMVVVMLVMLIPALVVRRITPVQAIRYD